jgi:y4mF family transcriptional regulator
MRVRSVLEVGAAARDRRERLGWSQQALAERAGVTREWVVRFEGGKPSVRLDRVFDVITALGLVVELDERARAEEGRR